MSGRQRWALSTYDYRTHLLADVDLMYGEFTARCGHRIPGSARVLDRPPFGGICCRTCEAHRLADTPGKFGR